MVHVTKLSKIILLQRVEVKRIYIYDRPVQVPNHFWKLIGTYLLLSKIYILCMDSLAWSSAFLIFWSECQNLTKLSEIPQMALLNSDKNVRISDSFVWNDLEIHMIRMSEFHWESKRPEPKVPKTKGPAIWAWAKGVWGNGQGAKLVSPSLDFTPMWFEEQANPRSNYSSVTLFMCLKFLKMHLRSVYCTSSIEKYLIPGWGLRLACGIDFLQ